MSNHFPHGRLSHGHTTGRRNSPTYSTWCNMITRCTNPKSDSYNLYGKVGISVCDRWRDFENFLADMGARPSPEHSLDRIDGAGNYEPGNCRWATVKEQQRNRKSCRPVVRSDGVRYNTIVEAAEAIGGCRRSIRHTCIGRQKSHLGFGWSYAE